MTGAAVGTPPNGEKVADRMIRAGVVGMILPVLLLAVGLLSMDVFAGSRLCEKSSGCLALLFYVLAVGRWVAIVLAWPLLYFLRVRSAWPVAAVAAPFLVAIWEIALAPWMSGRSGFGLILISGILAYPLAALVTAPRVSWPWRAVPTALLLALYLLTFLPSA
ncbi:hypothetical protein GCM10027187_43720 [Streptosporangium sandarakinum]|uniref:Uncharacterized protein n=1 Tax=Streptosporangium sandarakinum TaxID=1260955 RepID=A0A852V4I0_9ACTN|nr:hypothetical protein [Streptosporangium sandarakinum]NYF43010.1 hypothetical protein [Streptosporangium sandarakinum]